MTTSNVQHKPSGLWTAFASGLSLATTPLKWAVKLIAAGFGLVTCGVWTSKGTVAPIEKDLQSDAQPSADRVEAVVGRQTHEEDDSEPKAVAEENLAPARQMPKPEIVTPKKKERLIQVSHTMRERVQLTINHLILKKKGTKPLTPQEFEGLETTIQLHEDNLAKFPFLEKTPNRLSVPTYKELLTRLKTHFAPFVRAKEDALRQFQFAAERLESLKDNSGKKPIDLEELERFVSQEELFLDQHPYVANVQKRNAEFSDPTYKTIVADLRLKLKEKKLEEKMAKEVIVITS